MWKHVMYASFIYAVNSVSNKLDKAESDVSLSNVGNTNAVNRIENDVSYIDDRFERPGQIAPQILNFRLNTGDDNTQNIDYRWVNPETSQRQKIDFHIDVPDSKHPQILAFNLRSSRLGEYAKSFENLDQNGRRRFQDVTIRRNVNMFPQRIRKGNRKFIRGLSTTRNFPYVAAIIINGRLWCAGALVDENWVLTAGHCLNFVLHVTPLKSLADHVKVRVGSAHAHEGGELLDVVGAVRHPKFKEEPAPHADIALLKLSVNLKLSRYINIIKIYEGKKEPLPQSFIVIAGWGATKGGPTGVRDYTPDMNSGRLKVRSQTYCGDSYQLVNDFQFTPDLFCASLRNSSRDACLFDAGAPAVQQNRLMGIMSFGPEQCGENSEPAVFIKAFYFRDFVKSTIASYKTTKELIQGMQEITQDNNELSSNEHVAPADYLARIVNGKA